MWLGATHVDTVPGIVCIPAELKLRATVLTLVMLRKQSCRRWPRAWPCIFGGSLYIRGQAHFREHTRKRQRKPSEVAGGMSEQEAET